MATIAVPGLFAPVNIPPYVLIDGGVLNNLPIKQAREHGIDIIVAVDVQLNPSQTSVWSAIPNSSIFPFSLPDFFLEFYIAQLVMIAEMTNQQINIVKPEILIRPEIPPDINMFLGFPRALEIIRAGEKAALDALPSILKLLNK